MKIGIDIRTLMDEYYSGVSEHTFNLLTELFKIDSVNEYILYYNSFSDIKDRIPDFKCANVKIVNTRYPNKIFNYLLQKIFKYPKIDQVLGGVDVFLSPHINFLSLSNNVKKVLTVHDLSFLRYPEFFSWRKNFWHQAIGVKGLIKSFDKIVTVSSNTKNDLIDLAGVKADKVSVVYSGVSSEYKKIDPTDSKLIEVKNKYGLPDNFILYLGNIEPRKNIVGLIQAFNLLKEQNPDLVDLKLVLAGATGWKIKDIFKELEASPYREEIKFLGYIDRLDKVYLYNLAQVFVYPSFYEGFGFPPLEAMASGTPVITSNVSSLPEVVDSAAVMVDPFNVMALSNAMSEIIKDDNLKNKLSIAGLERAKEFTWAKAAQGYLEILKSLV